MHKKKAAIIIVIVLLIVACVIVFPVLSKNKRHIEEVTTQSVKTGSIESWFTATGTIQSDRVKQYYGLSQATVTKVYVKTGDKVKKGDRLADYDTSDLYSALRQAQLQLDNARLTCSDSVDTKNKLSDQINDLASKIAKLEKSSNLQDQAQLQSLKTQKNQLESSQISDNKLKQLGNAVAIAQLTVDAAQKRYNNAAAGMTADFDGIVTGLNLEEGSAAPMSQPALILQDNTALKAVVPLGKYDISKVKVGQAAKITSGDVKFDGEVSSIDPAAQTVASLQGQTTTLNCDISVHNPNDMLKINFEANVDIKTGDVKDVLTVPVEAVKTDKTGNNYVFVFDNGAARKANVTLGVSSDTACQIKSGLTLGQKVILNPGEAITDGVKVKEAAQS